MRIIDERLDVKYNLPKLLAQLSCGYSSWTQSTQASRTAKLWLQFMNMMDILRMFLKGERMGIWELHIQAIYEIMPYLAVSWHNMYTKCTYVYLQQMQASWNPSIGFQTLRWRAPGCTQIRSVLGRTFRWSCHRASSHAEHEYRWRINQRSWHDRNPSPRLVDGAPYLRWGK